MGSPKATKKTVWSSLFSRIVLRLTVPLFLLAAIFTGAQLTSQIKSLNELHHLEGQWAFPGVYKDLMEDIKNPSAFNSTEKLQERLQNIANQYRLLDLNIYDALEESPLFESQLPWKENDRVAVQNSLHERSKGNFYSTEIRKKTRQLIAYIPLPMENSGHLYVARAVLQLAGIGEALNKSGWTLGTIFFFILMTGVFIGSSLARSIIRPIRILNSATRQMMAGNLGMHVQIKTGDEIEALAHMFNRMSDAMAAMKVQAEDSNPLTGLPGNKSIFNQLQKRIHERQKFVAFHADLDRFKIFNDHYGLGKGDLAIKKTAEILQKVVVEQGNPDDFVGQQGGDDFMLITRPNRAVKIGEEICRRFDTEVMPTLYSKEDLQRGHTVHLDRRRQAETGEEIMREFPLLSISVAGISSAKKDFADYYECLNILNDVKKEAKKRIESCYIIRE